MITSVYKDKNSPSVTKIVEYWSNTPALVETDKTGEKHEEWFTPAIDIGEPSCFGCGIWSSGWDRGKDWKECWKIAASDSYRSLQRAHIVPRSLGGNNEPSNFVMLCKQCHFKNPHTTNRDLYIQWVLNRGLDKDKELEVMIKGFFKLFPILERFDLWEFSENAEIQDKFNNYYSERVTLHTCAPWVDEHRSYIANLVDFITNELSDTEKAMVLKPETGDEND
tara:strand:+ start:43 stop:711 length:669 start_codon:yes stop_codon:yes gene_type:complete